MATIKSYTDIKQSKKLAEILPLESADMHFVNDKHAGSVPYLEMAKGSNPWLKGTNISPCWSLASLLEETPEVINFDDDECDYALEILKEGGLYYLSYGNPFEHGEIGVEPQENFVDACYETILKLNEQNLL